MTSMVSNELYEIKLELKKFNERFENFTNLFCDWIEQQNQGR